MTQFTVLGVGVLTAVVSWLGVAAVRRVAERRHILDLPGARSLHTRPVPRGGGLAVVMVCLGALLGLRFVGLPSSPLLGGWVVVGGVLVASVSWVDDLHSLPVVARLAVHVAAAGCVLVAVGATQVTDIPLLGELHLVWLGPPVVLLWVVGLTNAYNFMDGIDGIAAAQAIVAGFGFFILPCADVAVRWLGVVLAAGCVGFLLHNWQPARIFLGDVGSAFIGYLLASLTVIANGKDPRFAAFGILLVWPFVFDAGFTLLRRLCHGEDVFAAHRSHFYQRLVIAGWQHWAVTVLYGSLAVFGVALAISWLRGGLLASVVVVAGLSLAAMGLWLTVLLSERIGASQRARNGTRH